MENNSNEMLYCLLGNEIKNSLSPIIHNSFFLSNNLEGYYPTVSYTHLPLPTRDLV